MRRIVVAAALAVVLPMAVSGQAKKPDFSGRWTLDVSKSDETPQAARGARAAAAGRAGGGAARGGGGAGILLGEGPVVITQTDTEITIGSQNYKLDGSTMPQGPRGSAQGKASWDGSTLVIETSRTLRGSTLATKELLTLSADGSEMTVETAASLPAGERKIKQVYRKN